MVTIELIRSLMYIFVNRRIYEHIGFEEVVFPGDVVRFDDGCADRACVSNIRKGSNQ